MDPDPTETIPGFFRMPDEEPHPGHTAQQDPDETQSAGEPSDNTAQCRICLDGPDPELGRLIRPCEYVLVVYLFGFDLTFILRSM